MMGVAVRIKLILLATSVFAGESVFPASVLHSKAKTHANDVAVHTLLEMESDEYADVQESRSAWRNRTKTDRQHAYLKKIGVPIPMTAARAQIPTKLTTAKRTTNPYLEKLVQTAHCRQLKKDAFEMTLRKGIEDIRHKAGGGEDIAQVRADLEQKHGLELISEYLSVTGQADASDTAATAAADGDTGSGTAEEAAAKDGETAEEAKDGEPASEAADAEAATEDAKDTEAAQEEAKPAEASVLEVRSAREAGTSLASRVFFDGMKLSDLMLCFA